MFIAATVNRAALVAALDVLSRMAPTRSTLPILSCVRLDVAADKARLSAFDLDTSLSVALDAFSVDGAGAVAVDCRTLRDVIRKTPRGALVELRPQSDGARLDIIAGRTRSTVNCLSAVDFPALPAVDYADSFAIGARHLSRFLSSVAPAFSDDPTRYYLGGAFLHVDGARLAVAATNGHLLLRDVVDQPGAVAAILSTTSTQLEPGLIVPAPVVDLLARLVKAELATGSAHVAPSLNGARLRIATGAIAIEAKAIDGTFPAYRRILPGAVDAVGAWKVDGADALAFYAGQPSPAGRANQPGIAAAYAPGVAIETCTGGASWSTAPGTYEGEAMTRGLQPRVARAAFQFFADAGQVVVELFADASAPMALRAIGKPGAIALAMPIKCDFQPAPVAIAAPYEPSFPGMARDLSDVENGCQAPGGKGPRQPTRREVAAYLRDLLARGAFPSHLNPVEPVGDALGAGVTYGAKLAPCYGPHKPGAGQQFIEGSFTLLIPGGRRGGEAITLDALDASGAVIKSQPVAMAPGKMTAKAGGLIISPADVADAVGPFEPVGTVAKRRTARPAPVPAHVEAVEAVEAPSVAVAPVPVAVAASVAALVNWQPAPVAVADPAPVAVEAEPVAIVEDVQAPPVAIVEPVAIVAEPAPGADDFAARLARIESALGLVAIAKRSPSHAATIRRAWAARCEARRLCRYAELTRQCLDVESAALVAVRAERDAARAQVDAAERQAREAVANAAQAIAAAESAIAERNAVRLDAAERAELVAAIDAARADAANENRNAVKVAHIMRRRFVQFSTVARGAARLRRDLARTRAERDGIAANLSALAKRAAQDGALIERLRPAPPVDADQPRRFILSSR